MADGTGTDQRTGDGAGAGADAGTATLTLTKAELQAQLDRAVQKALESNVVKHQRAMEAKEKELDSLRDQMANAGKPTEEMVSGLRETVGSLKDKNKQLEKALADLVKGYEVAVNARLAALGEKAKATFERVCPPALDQLGRFEMLEKMVADGLLVAGEVPSDAAKHGDGTRHGEDVKKGEGEGLPGPTAPNRAGDPNGRGGQPDESLSAADRMVERVRARANATQGVRDPWAKK